MEEQKYQEEIKITKPKRTRKQKINKDELLLSKIMSDYKDPTIDEKINYVIRRINDCKNDKKSQMEYLKQYKRYLKQL